MWAGTIESFHVKWAIGAFAFFVCFAIYHFRRLLWHGSRMSNWYGILSRGLLIAPPEAPSTGYMFGKVCYERNCRANRSFFDTQGVYLADVSSKSANYCFTTPQHNVGLLLLCDVALGKVLDLFEASSTADKRCKKEGCGAVRGRGIWVPTSEKTM